MRKISNLYLTIVGEGPEENILKRLVNNLGVRNFVSFVGHQDNPYPFMAYADLFISSSRWEGLPNVVLESLACGTPVLAFDCPGGTGEIIREGKNGWLVPSEDWEVMGEKIVEIVTCKKWLEMPSDTLLPEKFSCQNVLKMYEELLKQG